MNIETTKQTSVPLVKAAIVARHLGVSRATVYRMAQRHWIPCVHVGRAIRFCLEEVIRALAA